MTGALVSAIVVTGLAGIVAQTVLIRECFILFGGNELTIGIIIGAWVLWEAFGARVGGLWPRKAAGAGHVFLVSNLLFVLAFPASVYAVRIFKVLVGVTPEVSLDLATTLWASLVVFLPLGFTHGLAFTTACRFYEHLREKTFLAGRVYLYEMTGTIIGGILVSYVLVSRFHSFQIAALVLIVMSLACLAAALSLHDRSKALWTGLTTALAAVAIIALFSGLDDRFQARSIAGQWHGRRVISYENSPYQNIAVTSEMGQYTIFTDGLPAAAFPTPDITRIEEIVHIPLLAHGRPRDVLVLHSGAGGIVGEVLKYPTVRRVDHVEIDPAYLAVMLRFSGSPQNHETRLRIHETDGRLFVATTRDRYDVVLLGLSSPRTLQTNRFFTTEFFRQVRRILRDDGIFAFAVPGSLAYYDRELRDVNASALATVRGVFSDIAAVPGDENIIMASPAPERIRLSPERMSGLLRDYAVATRLVSGPHLSYRIDPERARWYLGAMAPSPAKENRDLSPVGLYYNLALASAHHSPWLKRVFTAAERRGTGLLVLAAALVTVAAVVFRKRRRVVPILYVISSTGFVVMMLELFLIFIFQVFYGFVFHEIGVLIAMLMAGMAAGSILASKVRSAAAASRAIMAAEGLLALMCFALVVFLPRADVVAGPGGVLLRLVLFKLLFIAGVLAGFEFPLAVAVHGDDSDRSGSVGPVYAADLLGGCVAGIIGGFFVFPVMGLTKSLLVLGAVKAAGLLLMASRRKKIV